MDSCKEVRQTQMEWGANSSHHPSVYPSPSSTFLLSKVCLCAIWSSSDLCKPHYEVIGQRFLQVWSCLNRAQTPRTACLILSCSLLTAKVRKENKKCTFIHEVVVVVVVKNKTKIQTNKKWCVAE